MNKKNNKVKGFTIIELIVVIAIIAVLAAIVLVNVTGWLNKSKDAQSIEYTHQLQAAAVSFYTGNSNSYTGLAADTMWTTITGKMPSSTVTSLIKSDGTVYCATVTMPSGATSWCTDNTGYVGTLVANKCTGTTFTCQ